MTHNEPDHFPDARKMVDLAARIERAEGPDRALDVEVWRLAEPNEYALWESSQRALLSRDWDEARRQVTLVARAKAAAPKFTGSLDAAMRLPPEGYTWYVWNTGSAEVRHPSDFKRDVRAQALTPALALCAAAMRARSAS